MYVCNQVLFVFRHDCYSTSSDLRGPSSNILIRLSSFEAAGDIMQAASLNCLVTKRGVAWSRNCRCAGVRSRVDNDFYSFRVIKNLVRAVTSAGSFAHVVPGEHVPVLCRAIILIRKTEIDPNPRYCGICVYLLREIHKLYFREAEVLIYASHRKTLRSCAISFGAMTRVLIH